MRHTTPRLAAIRPLGMRGTAISGVITGLSAAIALGIFALGAYLLVCARSNTWDRAERSSNNLVVALERDIARNIRLIDLSLLGVIEGMAEPGISEAAPQVRHRALFARAKDAEELGSVLVLDAYGTVVEDSTSVSPHRLNLADRDYFRVHMDRPDAGLYISRPFRSRLRENDASIAVSRRLPDKNGAFQGVVTGALRLDYLRRLFEHLDIGPKGSITLVRTDGRLLARHPFDDADLDRNLSGTGAFNRFSEAESGSFIARSALDGTKRFYSYQHIKGLPLILAVNMAVDDVLDPWVRWSVTTGSLLALLCIATATSCVLFRREMVRREIAERALKESADELARMASTDALTGLANRRGFEIEIHWEWKRALRGGGPIALVMIDADFFKSYNDRYGHIEGDRVLRMLATCIGASVRRPGDCAARYGGEEFAALLPDTDLQAALVVAEGVRAAVKDLAVPHAGAPGGVMTVSLGVAVAWPCPGSVSTGLVQAADAALYAAKRAGRDRVRAAEPMQTALSLEHSAVEVRTSFAMQAMGE
jgi:diguanylate cyclase (GGDEF)-like protein